MYTIFDNEVRNLSKTLSTVMLSVNLGYTEGVLVSPGEQLSLITNFTAQDTLYREADNATTTTKDAR